MDAQTYLFFTGQCEEAVDFYVDAIGARKEFLMRFREGPADLMVPGGEDKVFHATLRIGHTRINMADDMKSERGPFGGFALLLHADSDDEAEQYFVRLSKSGQIRLPLAPTMWASCYGIVVDKFGVEWKVQS